MVVCGLRCEGECACVAAESEDGSVAGPCSFVSQDFVHVCFLPHGGVVTLFAGAGPGSGAVGSVVFAVLVEADVAAGVVAAQVAVVAVAGERDVNVGVVF